MLWNQAVAAESWTLEQALAFASTNSPDARISKHRMAIAREILAQADAAFFPKVQLQGSYTRTDNPLGVFGAALTQRAYSSSLNFNRVPDADDLNVRGLLTVPLYSGGRSSAARDAAKSGSAAVTLDAETTRHAVAFEIAQSFHYVIKTRQFVRAAEAAIQALEGNLKVARHRLDAGTLLKTDFLDVEVRLAQSREDRSRAKNALALAEHTLRVLLGIEAGEITASDTTPSVLAPDVEDQASLPELAAARHRERAAEAEVRGTKSGFRPRVNAFGSVDFDHGWKFNSSGENYTGGVLLQWDLWDGETTRHRVAAAKAALDVQREEERKLRLALDLELKKAKLSLADARERLAVTDRVIAQASESANLVRARFEQGMALSAQLLDAETLLTTTQLRRADAECDERIAIAALRKALGLPQVPPSAAK